jgi:hypothetical protein
MHVPTPAPALETPDAALGPTLAVEPRTSPQSALAVSNVPQICGLLPWPP